LSTTPDNTRTPFALPRTSFLVGIWTLGIALILVGYLWIDRPIARWSHAGDFWALRIPNLMTEIAEWITGLSVVAVIVWGSV
jgi:hypothetical protein